METKKVKARGLTPAFYMDHKSTAQTFHADRRKVDEPRFAIGFSSGKKTPVRKK